MKLPAETNRECLYLRHRDWSLAGGREPCMLTGICLRRSGRSAFANRRCGISSISPIVARGDDFLTRGLARSRLLCLNCRTRT